MRHLAANALTVLIVLMVLASGVIYWGQAQFRAPGPLAEPVVVTVNAGDGLDDVAGALLAAGVIENDVLFRIGARYRDDARRLRFGEYQVPAAASMEEVLDLIVSGRSVQYLVTVPEGLTSWEVVQLLNEEPLLTGEIAEIPAEGSLAPDTYSVQRGEPRAALIARMIAAQERILAEAWAARVDFLPLESPEEA
ncbi:MAG: endolytic transglycosylase MltG, partial [Pseudomonadota bacterium]